MHDRFMLKSLKNIATFEKKLYRRFLSSVTTNDKQRLKSTARRLAAKFPLLTFRCENELNIF